MYNYSPELIGTFDIASTHAHNNKNQYLNCLHLIYGMAKNPNLICYNHLKSKLSDIEKDLEKLPSIEYVTSTDQNIKAGEDLIKWLQAANSLATQESQKEISEKHLIKSLPKEIKSYFKGFDFSQFQVNKNSNIQKPEFLIDLNQRAKQGKIDPVIGRQKEIRSVLEVLDRRSKNNPILLGEAGVGKTAVVEGLSNLIVNKDVPDKFLDKTIYSLDLSALMAGTKHRGDFEQRIQKLIKFVDSLNGTGIIFFDEIHTLIGSGSTGGAIDGANLLKPALARGQLKCIGATTHDEYQKFIMSDSALDRRFRAVFINEPSCEASIDILMGLKDRFEAHHGISIQSDAIYNAVFLTEKYIQNKKLPDKAIDLIDEACSAKKFSIESMPNELIELDAELREKKTLAKTEKCTEVLLEQINQLQAKFEQQKELWLAEVKQIHEFAILKKHLDKLRLDHEQAVKNADFETASKLKFADIPSIENKLSAYKVSSTLKKDDVADVLSRQTGIPKDKILANKQEKILKLKEFLKSKIFGQDYAIKEIAETLNISYAGLGDKSRPLGSFLLKGPSGVGKTATAKAISEFFFDRDDQVITIDLSEYSEKHSISKLIGSPAGYVGYQEGGYLTEMVRKSPYSVILFDEVEKAHINFSDILLQILDEGRLTDNKHRSVSFQNCIVFLTTNSTDIKKDFKPEVLGRLDGIINYNHLSSHSNKLLIDRELEVLNKSLQIKHTTISLAPDLYELLMNKGFSQEYGARDLKNCLKKLIIRPIAKMILAGKFNNHDNHHRKIMLKLDKESNEVQLHYKS